MSACSARRMGRKTDLAVLRCSRRLSDRGVYPTPAAVAAQLGRNPWTVRAAIRRLRGRGLAGWVRQGKRHGAALEALADQLHDEGLGVRTIVREILARTGRTVSRNAVRRWLGVGCYGIPPEAVARRAAAIRQGGRVDP